VASPSVPADVILKVNNTAFAGWKSFTVTRSIESLAGSFELEVYDRWSGQAEPWPIFEEDECSVEILGETVITGWVDRRAIDVEAGNRTFKISGRDKAGALVDCSAMMGGTWLFQKGPIADIAIRICEPFGISVQTQPGLTAVLPPKEKFVVNPGDKAGEALEKLCKMAGVLAVSDGKGGVLITRTGTTRIYTAIEEGVGNYKKISFEGDCKNRYFKYICPTRNIEKIPAKEPDKKGHAGAAARRLKTRAEAIDQMVRRQHRVKIVTPDESSIADMKAYAPKRVEFEAITAAAKAEKATVTMRGWEIIPGQLWEPNALVPLKVPSVQADGEVLITEVKYTLTASGGKLTELTLKRPDAFTPAPRLPPKPKGHPWSQKVLL
jgi:prophage tail gpP-like protein